ncbi:MAG: hypothetical protein VKP62_14520 [Candidatus Sericytochromatia bacterium]|nr:hypothetical protein [Candidatus Sericytochromatia bacterium]
MTHSSAQHPWPLLRHAAAFGVALLLLAGCGRGAFNTPARPLRTVPAPARLTEAMPAAPAGQPPANPMQRPTPSLTLVPEGSPGAGSPGLPAGARPAAPLPAQVTGPAAGIAVASPGLTEGAQLLAAVRQRNQSAKAFQAYIRTYSEGHFNGGKQVAELRKVSSEMKLLWASPARLRVEMIKTSNPLAEGALLTTQDTVTCRVRAKGLLSFLPITMPADDPRLANNRNHSLPETDPKSMMDRLTAEGAVWTFLGDAEEDGRPVKRVQVDQIRYLDGAITREVIAVDPALMALLRITMYAGSGRVFDVRLTDFTWTPTVAPDAFSS